VLRKSSVTFPFRIQPLRLLFWLLLAVPAGLLLWTGGRYLWARREWAAAQEELDKYAFDRALPHLQRCLEIWPDSLPTHLLAARTARRAGRLQEAQDQLKECQRLAPGSPDVALEEQLFRCQSGHMTADVETRFREAAQEGQANADLILEALALAYLDSYRLGAAQQCLNELLSREPDHVRAYVWRGYVRIGMGRYEEAEADFRKALELDPHCDEARLRLGEGLLTGKRPAEALSHFRYLHDQGKDSLDVLMGLARCERQLGQTAEARRLLQQADAQYPKSPAVLRELGEVALSANQPAEAERWLRRALDADPHDPKACYSLAQALRQLDRPKEADEYLSKSEQIDRDNQKLKEIVAKLGRRPGDTDLYCQAGLICLRNGQEQEGLRWLRGALQVDPRYGPAHRALADYYQSKGDHELARQHRAAADQAARP
jgi:tetratricopeptide (TPR) repeat protein